MQVRGYLDSLLCQFFVQLGLRFGVFVFFYQDSLRVNLANVILNNKIASVPKQVVSTNSLVFKNLEQSRA